MRLQSWLMFIVALAFGATAHASASRMPWHAYSDAEIAQGIAGLRGIESPDLDRKRIDALALRAATGQLDANDDNLICIGALAATFGATFGFGLVPNPPWDYLLGQVPAYAANLGLKFCRPVLDAPPDIDVHPNVASADGANCAYEFTQPVIEGTRADFMGLPLKVLGNWGFNATPTSRSLGTPSAFHYNTDVKVRLFLPGEAPPDYLLEVPDERFVARLSPGGILAPSIDAIPYIGCLLDGSVAFSSLGPPCPIDLDRRIPLGIGTHTLAWRGETELGLLDVLPPLYVPGTPPGSKKELAKAILKSAFEALGVAVIGSFQQSYPTGVVSLRQQRVRVFDTSVPSIAIAPGFQDFRIEAQEPGGQRTTGLLDVLRPGINAGDACNRVPQLSVPIPPFLALGTHQLTWTARDAGPTPAGGVNSASVVQTIIVEDTRAPDIKAPPPVVVEAASAPVVIDVGSPMVFDVADLAPAIERSGPTSFPFGTSVVRWRATDSAGNVSPWVEQRITVKAVGSNHAPVASASSAAGASFDEMTVPLAASDADGDHLFFYIDRQPEQGHFVAPLLPVFVEDLRVERQVTISELQQHCATVNAPLPPQSFIYQPEYVTVDDNGNSYVIDRELYCFGSSLPRSLFDRARIARLSPDGALLGQHLFSSSTTIRKLSFHAGGLPGYPQPFVYWVDRQTQRLLVLAQTLTGSVEVIRLDLLAPGAIVLNNHVDAAIDSQGILYVTDTAKVYAFDFLTRPPGSSNATLFLGRLGAPASQSQGHFGQAWDMDIDSADQVYVGDWERNRIHKFSASTLVRGAGGGFAAGAYRGWMGRCDSDTAPGGAAACDVASARSLGYACTDSTCGSVPTAGSSPGQFNRPQGFAIDGKDILYVADRQNNRVQRFTPEGLFAGQARSSCTGSNCFVIGQFGTAADVSVNATGFYVLDQDTDILHIFSANPVTMTGPNTAEVTYRSFNNFIGVDSFAFFASDGLRVAGTLGRSNLATASVAVAQNSRPPFATPGMAAAGDEDTPIAIQLDGSDADIGNDYPWEPLEALEFALSTPPAHGSVSVSDTVATYLPDPNWHGSDRFGFTATDGVFVSAAELVSVEVRPINDAPVLTAPTEAHALVAGVGFSYEVSIAVRDPDDLDQHSLQVNWGDGTVENGGELLPDGTITGPLIDFNASGDGLISGRHTYAGAGPRTLGVCVTDAFGASGCASFAIAVVAMTDLAVFEAGLMREVQTLQPIAYTLGVSNLAPTVGAGITATGVALHVELDPRLNVIGHSGANCSGSGNVLDCSLPNLAPIPRGAPGGVPAIDRQVLITTLPASSLPIGSVLGGRAELSAVQPNRSPVNQLALSRYVVANADFVVSSGPLDSADANLGNGICADAQGRCSLRAAVMEANALGGPRRIALSAATYRLDQGELDIVGDVTLIGLGVGLTEIVGDSPARLFDIAADARFSLAGMALSGTQQVADRGGLLRNAGELEIEDALLQNGQASAGGAIANEAGAHLTLERVALVGNTAAGAGMGGAIHNSGVAGLENVLLFDNRANAGGALFSSPTGPGVDLTLNHCTVVGNRASAFGAALFGNSSAPMASLSNTILADNVVVDPGGGGQCGSRLLSTGGNLVNDNLESCPFVPASGDQIGVAPLLEAYLGDGSRQPTLQPSAQSPAIGAAVGICPVLDLRGSARGSSGACDVGAYRRIGEGIHADGFEN
jgi:sugar lactone lactonase YvrE